MASRIIVIEVPDTRTSEDVTMAIQSWNAMMDLEGRSDRHIHILHQMGFPTTDVKEPV